MPPVSALDFIVVWYKFSELSQNTSKTKFTFDLNFIKMGITNNDLQTPNTMRAKPFLKWAGGKSQLLTQFEQLYPRALHTRKITNYVEPSKNKRCRSWLNFKGFLCTKRLN